jgi:hypothetical protein
VVLQVHDDTGRPTPPRSGRVPGPPEGDASPGRDAEQPAIHSPSQGEGQPTTHSHGGGLGLRLVRALVEEELNGQFTLSHPAGRGSIATAIVPPVVREA